MKYFAFGANTNLMSMRRRVPAAVPIGPATLPNHILRFAIHADVVPCSNSTVVGMLW